MNYDRDRAGREQDATEAMIRMRGAPAPRGEWRSKMRPKDKPYSASEWNGQFPIGTRVTRRRDSGGDLTTETVSTAFYRKGGWSQEGHFVFVEGIGSPVPLDHLTVLPK
jgi:hypothetical protein